MLNKKVASALGKKEAAQLEADLDAIAALFSGIVAAQDPCR
jgi:hypothetical protein